VKIKDKTGKEYPKPVDKEGEMGIKRKYIKEHFGLSDRDDKLITSFVGVLNATDLPQMSVKFVYFPY
jgi:hypothetical protein